MKKLARRMVLSIIVFTLFILSMFKTCEMLGIHVDQKEKKSSEEQLSKEERMIISYNNQNTFQTSEKGEIFFDKGNIYYNDDEYFVKYSKNNTTPIMKGHIKNIIGGGEYLFGTITMADEDDILKDFVLYIKDGKETVFYKTASSFITSLAYDGTYLYYTNESNSIMRFNLQDSTEPEIYIKSNQKNDYPVIIGIKKHLYYCDGTGISYIDLNKNTTGVLTDQGCSELQKPIIYEDNIYMLSLQKDKIIEVSTKDGTNRELADFKKYGKIDNFNVQDGYLFVNIGGNLYYSSLKDGKINLYRIMEGNTVCIGDDTIFFIEKNGIKNIGLNWIFTK